MIPIVELIRLEEDFIYGTFGVWKVNKEVFCVTLEPPDIENARNISSIPAQQYMCRRKVSPKYGETFEICDVPFRTNVLVHPGNEVEDTRGCVLLAQHWGKLKGDRAVINSGNTFWRFMQKMTLHNRFHLTIREVY